MQFLPVKIADTFDRKAKAYAQVCPNCQCERLVTYAQAWNLKKGNSLKECRPCQLETGILVPNLEGLKKGRKKWPRVSSKLWKNQGTKYKNLFIEVSESTREKQSTAKIGKFGPLASRWEGGKSAERRRIMSTALYKKFAAKVLNRHEYKCTECKSPDQLHVHHVKSWSKFPRLRMKLSNCTVLCKPCHMKVHFGSR